MFYAVNGFCFMKSNTFRITCRRVAYVLLLVSYYCFFFFHNALSAFTVHIDFRRSALDTTILPREPDADNGGDGGNSCGGGGGGGYLWSPLVISHRGDCPHVSALFSFLQ